MSIDWAEYRKQLYAKIDEAIDFLDNKTDLRNIDIRVIKWKDLGDDFFEKHEILLETKPVNDKFAVDNSMYLIDDEDFDDEEECPIK